MSHSTGFQRKKVRSGNLRIETDVEAAARTLALDANQAGGSIVAAIRARSATGALSPWAESDALELTDSTPPPQVVDLTASAGTALDVGYTIRSSSGEMGDAWQAENIQNQATGSAGPRYHATEPTQPGSS